MALPAENGIISIRSPHSVPETLTMLEASLVSHGLSVFAHIDHSGEAAKAGLAMRPAHLLIFGNPTAGTPLMVASPLIAIDLPLKALVWEDSNGQVWISINTPDYLKWRHDVPEALLKNISGLANLIENAIR